MNRRRAYLLSTIKLLDILLALGAFLATTFVLLPSSTSLDEFLGMRVKLSNFMIGVTAASAAGVDLRRGLVLPFLVVPVAVAVLVGAS